MPLPYEVWIGYNPAGAPQIPPVPDVLGSGTTDQDPFDGSSSARFDAVMRFIATVGGDRYIHILPDHNNEPYKTRGRRHDDHGENPTGGNLGWDVNSGWRISGAGDNLTTIQLEQWPWFLYSPTPPNPPEVLTPLGDDPYNPPSGSLDSPSDSVRGGKWVVVGNSGYDPHQVYNVLIENLTVDGNWEGIPAHSSQVGSRPANIYVALICIACIKNARRSALGDGGITYLNVTATGFYGKRDLVHNDPYGDQSKECFAMTSGANPLPMDPSEIDSKRLSVIDHCTVYGGSGDYCVGIALAGPGIIDRCHVYSLANEFSGAIQVFGNDILLTNCIVRDCVAPFYVDTGNIVNFLMEGNQFLSTAHAAILTNSTNRSVWINVRQDHIEGKIPAGGGRN